MKSFTISYAASYVLRFLSIILSGVIFYPIGMPIENNLLFFNFIVCIINIGVVILLSKIVKINLKFLLKKEVNGILILIAGMVFFIYSFMEEYNKNFSVHLKTVMVIGIALLCYGSYSWWCREKTISKNEDQYEILESKYQSIIDEKERNYQLLKETHDLMALKGHKDNATLNALQETVIKIAMETKQVDLIKTATILLKEIDKSRDRFDKIKSKRLYKGYKLPQIGQVLIDTKFEMLFSEARTKNIDFSLEIHGNFEEWVFEETVSQIDLINIIGDFAKNAFIAIKHLNSKNPCRQVHFVLKNNNEILELIVEDSGIPFEISTLISLGIKPITTHADDGGSGFGYETIFEMMDEYKASLIITEYEQSVNAYSKQVALCFDGKETYIIKSPRADKIKKQNANKRDIKIF